MQQSETRGPDQAQAHVNPRSKHVGNLSTKCPKALSLMQPAECMIHYWQAVRHSATHCATVVLFLGLDSVAAGRTVRVKRERQRLPCPPTTMLDCLVNSASHSSSSKTIFSVLDSSSKLTEDRYLHLQVFVLCPQDLRLIRHALFAAPFSPAERPRPFSLHCR